MSALQNKFTRILTACLLFLVFCSIQDPAAIKAEVMERVVAVVNDEVILLSEFNEDFIYQKKIKPEITPLEVLDRMIDRALLLEQARKFMSGSPSVSGSTSLNDDDVIDEYVDRRIRSLIHIHFDDIEAHYNENRVMFAERSFYDVRDEIEALLADTELERMKKEHLDKIRQVSYIRVRLDNGKDWQFTE
jgi:hypothetical protein